MMSDSKLKRKLESVLTESTGRPLRIVRLTRRQSEYCASFRVEEIDVVLDDGTSLELIYKQLDPTSMLEEARGVKPAFVLDPGREIDVYRHVLIPSGIEAATFHAAVGPPEHDHLGVVLQRVPGRHLWQVGDFAAWEQAARWLAVLHTGAATRAAARCDHLLRYDRDFHRTWIDRARRFVCEDPARIDADRAAINQLAARYGPMIDRLCELPAVFIHGDYHPSNIFCESSAPFRIRPIDWEMAGLGPAAIDLAALTAGSWNPDQRRQMIAAYHHALPPAHRDATSLDKRVESVEYCRLHWAVRWLGWSPGWTPPRAQARDWLADALAIARQLGLLSMPTPAGSFR
jgi:Ser/Thr protein kinase RdoA (MazF antagonist)